MRIGRAVRMVGRAAVVGVLGLGGTFLGGHAALANDVEWDSVPAVTDSANFADTGAVSTLSDVEWD